MNSSVCKNILEETDGVFNSMVSEPYYWILEKVNIFAATILSQAVLLSFQTCSGTVHSETGQCSLQAMVLHITYNRQSRKVYKRGAHSICTPLCDHMSIHM